MAHKKGQSSSKNGRESHSKRLGIKKFGEEVVKAGNSDMAENYRKDAKMCRNAKNQLIMQH